MAGNMPAAGQRIPGHIQRVLRVAPGTFRPAMVVSDYGNVAISGRRHSPSPTGDSPPRRQGRAEREARARRIKVAFDAYDRSGDGMLEVSELRTTFKALGNFSAEEIQRVGADLDTSGDGTVSLKEFEAWILREVATERPEIAKAKAILAPSDSDGLEATFYTFCAPGHADMSVHRFISLCRACKLLDAKVKERDVELILSSSKVNARHQIKFHQFELALRSLAERKGADYEDVKNAALNAPRGLCRSEGEDGRRASQEAAQGDADAQGLQPTPRVEAGASRAGPRTGARHRKRVKLQLGVHEPVDNSNLWKTFGLRTEAGRALKLLYSPRQNELPA